MAALKNKQTRNYAGREIYYIYFTQYHALVITMWPVATQAGAAFTATAQAGVMHKGGACFGVGCAAAGVASKLKARSHPPPGL